jgi:GAF domain-containing protein
MENNKNELYNDFLQQAEALIVPELPVSGNICNLLALFKKYFGHFWVGLYLRQGDRLALGPFIGEPACTLIEWGKGVCGTAASRGETVIVEDVRAFPGYIACHPEPQSEIVVPGRIKGEVQYVLDVDSIHKSAFDETDQQYLEQFNVLISGIIKSAEIMERL